MYVGHEDKRADDFCNEVLKVGQQDMSVAKTVKGLKLPVSLSYIYLS